MNKEEILAKSRNENKNADVFEKEVLKQAGNVGCITAAIVTFILFVLEIFIKGHTNYGLWAILFSILSTQFIVKAIKLKRKHELVIAICYTLLTILLIAAYIWDIVTTSKIL